MDLFDVVGPIMVGPSSSHTAGAVRMGYVAGCLLGEPVRKAEILLYGSFYATGEGHGTRKAIVAGLLGMKPDDYQIAESLTLADQRGIEITFGVARLEEAHPNTAIIRLWGVGDKSIEVQVSSLGGSRINVDKIDGIDTNFTGECPTLIVHNLDQPGHVSEVTMQLYRSARGQKAVMVVECDQEIPQEALTWLNQVEGILKVTYFAGIS